jgi:hypothetical protein
LEKENKPEANGQEQERPFVVDNADGTKTVHLSEPITMGKDAKQDAITFRKPKLGVLRALDAAGLRFGGYGVEITNAGSAILKAVELLGGLHPDVVDEISFEDTSVIVETVADFLGISHLIGNISFGV